MARPWVGYFIRGVFSMILVCGLFLPDATAQIAQMEVGFFFLANGGFSYKLAKGRGGVLSALVSILGGVIIVGLDLYAKYLASISADLGGLGRYFFSPIAILIGLLQVQGQVLITPEVKDTFVLVKRPHVVLGVLEILLGISILMFEATDWIVRIITHVWLILVMLLMFATAYRLRKQGIDSSITKKTKGY